MSAASDFLETNILTHLLRTGSWAKPANIFVALFTSATTDIGGGTEVTGGSYARVSVAPLDANWSAPVDVAGSMESSNVAAITFPAPTADWGTVTHYALFDAITGGNLLAHGQLAAPKTILNLDPAPRFNANQLKVRLA